MKSKKEKVEEPKALEIATSAGEIVKPVVTPEQFRAAWDNFQALKKVILEKDDYQEISMFQQGKGMVKRNFIKKSGWRKLAAAFNLSDEIVTEVRKELIPPNFVVEIGVKVTAPNGRFAVGIGSCSSGERKFAHTEHDVRSTAHTRAKNRAISDLIGGGEVSAEEVENAKQVSEEKCSIDHDKLPIKTVQKEGKNKGRTYIVCENCKYWRWKDKDGKDNTDNAVKE